MAIGVQHHLPSSGQLASLGFHKKEMIHAPIASTGAKRWHAGSVFATQPLAREHGLGSPEPPNMVDTTVNNEHTSTAAKAHVISVNDSGSASTSGERVTASSNMQDAMRLVQIPATHIAVFCHILGVTEQQAHHMMAVQPSLGTLPWHNICSKAEAVQSVLELVGLLGTDSASAEDGSTEWVKGYTERVLHADTVEVPASADTHGTRSSSQYSVDSSINQPQSTDSQERAHGNHASSAETSTSSMFASRVEPTATSSYGSVASIPDDGRIQRWQQQCRTPAVLTTPALPDGVRDLLAQPGGNGSAVSALLVGCHLAAFSNQLWQVPKPVHPFVSSILCSIPRHNKQHILASTNLVQKCSWLVSLAGAHADVLIMLKSCTVSQFAVMLAMPYVRYNLLQYLVQTQQHALPWAFSIHELLLGKGTRHKPVTLQAFTAAYPDFVNWQAAMKSHK